MTTQRRGSPEPAGDREPGALVGQVVDGRYEIVELIGEGGMGRVYRARHKRLQRSVAVKVLHREFSVLPEAVQRFEREAIALARLDHPNCIAVQDFGRLDDGSLYLVVSHLPGVLLRAALDQESFSVARALHVARHVLSGLSHAHKAGIVHRDVKPENVMLVRHEGDADFAKLFDFGIVKLMEAEGEASANLTRLGQRFGTPAYMSPEQALGRSVDARSDLYSLTVMLYEMLTGRQLFEADDAEGLLVMHAAKAPPPLDRAGTSFAPALQALVARGLAKDPAQRFASAEAYLTALDACAAPPAPASAAAPPSRSRRLVARALRSRRFWGATLLVLLLAGGGFELHRLLSVDHAARARALLAGGRPLEAATYLQERLKEIADDAPAQLELGNAYAALRRYDEALVAYERVRSIDRSLANDRAMRTNLMLMLDDERNDTATGAARFLIQFLDDEGARARLVELASRSRSPAHRAAMRELAESLGLSGRVDLGASYRLDLVEGASCPDRQLAVAKLRALRDPSAVAALQKAQARKANACLRVDAADAVRYLGSLAEAPGSE
jgi:tetratricopeptide (TPR) repeat protein